MKKKILLIYGKVLQNNRIDIEVIDLIKSPILPNIPDSTEIYCLASAYIYASKKLSKNRLISINSIDDIPEDEPPFKAKEVQSLSSAAKIDNVLISQSYNSASTNLPIWMNQYHLECINNIFGKGCKIELLDDNERIIKVVEK